MTDDEAHQKTYLLDDPEIDSEERREIELHLESCVDCRRNIASFRRARSLLKPSDVPSVEGLFVERVLKRVGENGARKRGIETLPARKTRFWSLPLSVLAAMLLIATPFYLQFRETEATTQDLLTASDEDIFYEWVTAAGSPSEDEVLAFVLTGFDRNEGGL